MIYRFLQLFMRLVLRVYFRKIYFTGSEKIPADKPLILACNHPNSFLDAVLLAVLTKEPLHFLARSDVFNTSFKKWLLGKINLIPIYRLQEGAEKLHKNEETFDLCYRLFARKGRVLIFSEGLCILEKRLRPLKKGTARLAFGAESQHQFTLGLAVVPVGINYTYGDQFRKEVMISIGEPILVKDFEAVFATNPARAVMAFNQQLRQQLQQNMLIVENPEHEPLAEFRLQQQRYQSDEFFKSKWLVQEHNWLTTEQQVVAQLPVLNADTAVKDTPPMNSHPPQPNQSLFNTFWLMPWQQRLILILGFPLYLFAFILNWLPFKIAKFITRQKVKHIEFYSSVLMVLGMMFYLFYWLLLTIVGYMLADFFGWSLFILLPLSSCILLAYRDWWCYWQGLLRLNNKTYY